MNTIKLGDVTVTRIEDLHGPIMPTADFFPGMPAHAWRDQRDMLVPDHLGAQDNLVHIAMQSWLITSADQTIIVDTGVGNDKHRPAVPAWDRLQTDYLTRLAAAGVTPDQVDLVVNTHLHVDHVGWNTRLVDGAWVPTFPNATYLMPHADFEHFDPAHNATIPGGVNEYVFEDSIAPVHAAGQVRLWQDTHTIDANLRLLAAPGHTPGSSVITLQSGEDSALFAGDIVHTPLQLPYPDHSSCFCENPEQARRTRHDLLRWAADHQALVLPAHFSGHSALKIESDGNSFAIAGWGSFPRY